MAQPVARVGDVGNGICPSHGPVTMRMTQGCAAVTADGIPLCTVGHAGIASCGHPTRATTGSGNTDAEGQPIHRVGDGGVINNGGSYVITSGSPNVDSE